MRDAGMRRRLERLLIGHDARDDVFAERGEIGRRGLETILDLAHGKNVTRRLVPIGLAVGVSILKADLFRLLGEIGTRRRGLAPHEPPPWPAPMPPKPPKETAWPEAAPAWPEALSLAEE